MNLIDRYIHEVGRYLPRKNRNDILVELRSHLTDTLEERVKGEASEDDIAALLKEFGSPQKLAASYAGNHQYLIGPDLYPLFRMIAVIVVAAVTGAQLLAYAVGFWIGEQVLNPWQTLGGILVSIPSAIGWLVITFMILQRFGVHPKLDDEPWDPRSLPKFEETEIVKRGESIFGIAAGTGLLAFIVFFPEKIGVVNYPGGEFFGNPVILQYLGLIIFSLSLGICLNIYLLWKGRQTKTSRIVSFISDIVGILVLAFLFQGHNVWLAQHGSSGFLPSIELFAENVPGQWQLMSMEAFRFGFGIALVVVTILTIIQLIQSIISALRGNLVPKITA